MSEGAGARFSDKAEYFARFRPRYPKRVVAFLREECGLTVRSVVADVGSGTGNLSRPFVDNGNKVYGVEPNARMRAAAERLLGGEPRFHSVPGTAEATSLQGASVDLVVVGNALHWIDGDAARVEFARVLRPEGRVAVVWNENRKTGTPLHEAVEGVIRRYGTRHGTRQGGSESLYRRTEEFFDASAGGRPPATAVFHHAQDLTLEGLQGLALSYSILPACGEPGAEEMLADLAETFRAHEEGGQVTIQYAVRVYCGGLSQPRPCARI